MDLAIAEASSAAASGESPVGCIITTSSGEIIAKAHNTRETDKNPLGHAEINAISQAAKALGCWRLSDCTLFVTLEPCPMCMGAILNARIKRVIFGAYDLKAGCCGSLINLNEIGYPHKCEILGGIRELSCANLLTDFFSDKR